MSTENSFRIPYIQKMRPHSEGLSENQYVRVRVFHLFVVGLAAKEVQNGR